jgi:hypothetical protein
MDVCSASDIPVFRQHATIPATSCRLNFRSWAPGGEGYTWSGSADRRDLSAVKSQQNGKVGIAVFTYLCIEIIF